MDPAPLSARFGAGLELAADGCEFIAGVRATGDGAAAGVKVVARVSRRSDGDDVVIFDEELITRPATSAPWRDRGSVIRRRVADGSERAELIFHAERSDGGLTDGIEIAWSSPHVVCRSLEPERLDAPRKPHLVLISIDTLRSDHMSLYGYRR